MSPNAVYDQFADIFPFWVPRVAKWQPKGKDAILLTLSDHNRLYFAVEQDGFMLRQTNKGGKIIYDSREDSR